MSTTSWADLPFDVKLIIVKPLDRISKISLRQCSHDDKLLMDRLFVPIKEINFFANVDYITITFDHELSDFFEKHEEGTAVRRQENLIPFARFLITDSFQHVAWRSLRNMLKCQGESIDTLTFTFIGSLRPREEEIPQRIVPQLPAGTIKVRKITINGESKEAMSYQIIRFAKPEIEELNMSVQVLNISEVSAVPNLEQVKNVKLLRTAVPMTVEQALELNAKEVNTGSTLITDEGIVALLKKSLQTGNPSVFSYYRMWPDHLKIIAGFNSTVWVAELSSRYTNIPAVALASKNYILKLPEIECELFVSIQRYTVSGVILNKL